MNKLKIFISAYACEPNQGSEIGVGWHWILEMSKCFNIWVLTRKSNQKTIESWISQHAEFDNIKFIYFDLPKWARFWKKGLRGVRTYYNIWQYCTNGIVKRTMQENDIKIFHHLTYGNCLWKVSSYGQKQLFVWGPVGGVETIAKEFTKHYDLRSRVIESLRRMIVKSLKYNIGFNRRCRNANLIFCKTEVMWNIIPVSSRSKAILFTDVAVEELKGSFSENETRNTCVNYLTIGRLDAWRGFDLIIESFAQAVKKKDNIHLTIVGEGNDLKRLNKQVKDYELLSYVSIIGKVSRPDYYKLMEETDVVINASLKEGGVTVSFDCLALGKPLICIDTTGYTHYFSDDYAIKIPLQGRDSIISKIEEGILCLTDKSIREKMGKKARIAGEHFTWEYHGKKMHEAIINLYNQTI